MITQSLIDEAKASGLWIIAYLKNRIRGFDHFESPSSDVRLCGSLLTMKCPCDDVELTTSLDNISAFLVIPSFLRPHQDLTPSEILDRLMCSEYLKVDTKFLCKDSLIDALEEMYGKGNVEYHEEATNLYGYHNDVRKETAEIIVRKKFVGNASNDLGFKLQQDGSYMLIRSAYDASGHFNNIKLHKLEGLYSKNAIASVALQHRKRVESKQISPTKLKLRIYI